MGVEVGFDPVGEVEDRELLFAGRFEPGRDVAAGDDQGVAGVHGVGVAEGYGEVVLGHELSAGQVAERAMEIRRIHCPEFPR